MGWRRANIEGYQRVQRRQAECQAIIRVCNQRSLMKSSEKIMKGGICLVCCQECIGFHWLFLERGKKSALSIFFIRNV